MAWLMYFFMSIVHNHDVFCSLDEVKSGERLMASLQRIQTNLHHIRSIITTYSDHYCQSSLNKTEIGLVDLQKCANHQIFVKDEWANVMNPTLFELRHFRRALLKVTGERKILSPYFLAKISNFIQDEDNIINDAIRIATLICVKYEEESPETQTIIQELKKFEGNRTTENVAEATESPSSIASRQSTTNAPISASFGVEEWLILTTTSPKTGRPNDMGTITKANEAGLISDVGSKSSMGEYTIDEKGLIFSSGSGNPDQSTVNKSITPEGTAHPLQAAIEGKDGSYQKEDRGSAEYSHHGNLTRSEGEMKEREWQKQLPGIYWSDYNYENNCSGCATNSVKVGVIEYLYGENMNENYENFIEESSGFLRDLSISDEESMEFSDFSGSTNLSTTADNNAVFSVIESEMRFHLSTTDRNARLERFRATNNYTMLTDGGYKSTNCTGLEIDDDDCILERKLAPLGTQGPTP